MADEIFGSDGIDRLRGTADENVGLPTRDEIERLPRRAAIAFAARCARRVLPLFLQDWPDAPKKHMQAVEQAVQLAERCGITANVANLARGAALDADAAAFATFAVNSAANAVATAAAAAADTDVFAAVTAAVRASVAASYAYAAVVTEIRADFDQLARAAVRFGWDDDTPVHPSFFPPLPGQEIVPLLAAETEIDPPGERKDDGEAEYTLRFEVPEGVSDEEFIAALKELLDAGDDLHRSLGGHDIKVKRISASDHVPAGVPIGGVS